MSNIGVVHSWDTSELPQREKFEYWRDAVMGLFDPISLQVAMDRPFNGKMKAFEFNDIWLAQATSSAYQSSRSRNEIGRLNNGYYHLLSPSKGRVVLCQGNKQVTVHANQATFLAGDQPFSVNFIGGENELISLQVPASQLDARVTSVRNLCVQELTKNSAVGVVLVSLLKGLPRALGSKDPHNLSILRHTVLDLIEVTLREASGNMSDGVHARQRVDSHMVQRFIETHLSDPELSPAKVAAALNVSVRTVHARFDGLDTTFMRFVRECRLQKIAKCLTDCSGARPRLTDIIFEWGFSDASTFNRAFRKLYGVAPRDYRRKVLDEA